MKTNESSDEKIDVYQIVTNRIIELLEAGVVPWHKPWAAGAEEPINLVSKKAYRGVNVWLLASAGFGSPYWVSYKQAQELGGQVRKGESSTLVVFWKQLKGKDKATGEDKVIPVLRYYRVFNVEQCDGLTYPMPEPRNADFNPLAECTRIVEGYKLGPIIEHKSQRACYSRQSDVVNMPVPESFDSSAEYYSTLFHELTHSTGHESRLGRLQNSVSGFGSTSYAKEELIAEMGAAFLSAVAGIGMRVMDNSATYIQSWLMHLKNDKKLVVGAAAAAQKSSELILGRITTPV